MSPKFVKITCNAVGSDGYTVLLPAVEQATGNHLSRTGK